MTLLSLNPPESEAGHCLHHQDMGKETKNKNVAVE